jgi:Zn-dependent oligopeptidase
MPTDLSTTSPDALLDALRHAITTAQAELSNISTAGPSPRDLMLAMESCRDRVYRPLALLDLCTRVARTEEAITALRTALQLSAANGHFMQTNRALSAAVQQAAEEVAVKHTGDRALRAFFQAKTDEQQRAGAALDADTQQQLGEINKRLAQLANAFRGNVERANRFSGPEENRDIIIDILRSRSQMAQILGYDSFLGYL